MRALYVLSVWVHIVAAATWVGGALFLVIVLVPTAKRLEFLDEGMAFVHQAARRFLWVGWACLALLIATGLFNLVVHGGLSWELLARGEFWSSPYGRVLAGKLALVGVILILSAAHDFFLGPLASKAYTQDRVSSMAGRLRLAARWAGRVNLLLGLITIGLGATLVRGWPW